MVQPGLIIIDEDGCRDVHRVAQGEPFLDAALPEAILHLRGDVDECPSRRDIEPQFFAIAFRRPPPAVSLIDALSGAAFPILFFTQSSHSQMVKLESR